MLRITRASVFPKGGWTYVQKETGMRFGGNERFRSQVNKILNHRIGNNLPRATWEESELDLVEHTCARLPGICVEDGKTIVFSAKSNTVTETAKTDSAPKKKRKCGSCGGRKAPV